MNNTFTKDERLCGLKAFEQLVKNSRSKLCFPIKVSYLITDQLNSFPVKIAFAVPKKRFKRANKRNSVKRKLREAFRLNKSVLYNYLIEKNLRINVLFVYVTDEIKDYSKIESAVKNAFAFIIADIEKTIK